MNRLIMALGLLLFTPFCYAQNITDDIADTLSQNLEPVKVYRDYNFESTVKIPIRMKIVDDIKSENDLYEGQILKFKITKDVLYKNKVIVKRGDIVPARVSVVITPGMNGIPASIILSDFKINGITDGQLTTTYEFFGQDRSLWVFPLKWALTPIPPTGSLTNFIKGGHAKIRSQKPIEIYYYYPEWE